MPAPSDDQIEVYPTPHGTSYRLGTIELSVDNDGSLWLLIHIHGVQVEPAELRAFKRLLSDRRLAVLIEGE